MNWIRGRICCPNADPPLQPGYQSGERVCFAVYALKFHLKLQMSRSSHIIDNKIESRSIVSILASLKVWPPPKAFNSII